MLHLNLKVKEARAIKVDISAPSKHRRFRFPEDVRERLLQLKWWVKDGSIVNNLPFGDVRKCVAILEGHA